MKSGSPLQIYNALYTAYGAQLWWPAETPFEMMIGAILTQNTSWQNVEQAINKLKAADMLHYAAIASCNHEKLADLIRPSGYYNQKARYLQSFALFYLHKGKISQLKKQPQSILRKRLLALNGIGPETADSMLLYALDKPVFVIDAYTKRIFSRLGLIEESYDYHQLQNYFHRRLSATLPMYQEYHALIVQHAKSHCLKKPQCENCPLANHCEYLTAHPISI